MGRQIPMSFAAILARYGDRIVYITAVKAAPAPNGPDLE
jgi:hypothetical protein